MKDRPEEGRNEGQWAAVQPHVGTLRGKKYILIAISEVLFMLNEV